MAQMGNEDRGSAKLMPTTLEWRNAAPREAVGCIFAEASWKYWIGTILLGLELTNLRAERRTVEDSIEDWWGDLNLLDLAAVGVANFRFRT